MWQKRAGAFQAEWLETGLLLGLLQAPAQQLPLRHNRDCGRFNGPGDITRPVLFCLQRPQLRRRSDVAGKEKAASGATSRSPLPLDDEAIRRSLKNRPVAYCLAVRAKPDQCPAAPKP